MIGVVGDLHIGARSGNKLYHEYFNLFFQDLFSWIDKNSVKEVIQLGDLFDVRKHVDTWCLDFFKKNFVEEVLKRDLKVYVIVGNHDIHFKDSLEVNTPRLVLSEWPENFVVIDTPQEFVIDRMKFLLVPWITKLNRDLIEKTCKESKADYLCGHFEFNGFPMHKGSNAKSSHEHQGYSKFKKVFSGHYHTKSERDNVIYAGTPYETTWIDANDEKGFYVIKSGKISFVPNVHTFHEYVKFPETRDVGKKFIRGVIEDSSDKKAIERWKNELLSTNPHDLKFQEKTQVVLASSVNMAKIKSTEELIFEFVDETETQLDKTKIKNMMAGFYQLAMGEKTNA